MHSTLLWLLTHVSDPTLDDPMPREYILYLCPMGPLLDQLNDFFHDSYIQCGRNAAHNYLPHLTLCSFFQVGPVEMVVTMPQLLYLSMALLHERAPPGFSPLYQLIILLLEETKEDVLQAPDESVPHLMRALQHVADKLIPEFPEKLDLDPLFVSSTFLGLFLTPRHNDALKRLAVLFMREVSDYKNLCHGEMWRDHQELMLHVAVVSEMGALDVLGTCFPWCSSSSYPALAKGGRRIQVEPYLKGLHITLASHFPPEHLQTLEDLARGIDATVPAQWELRLYSRDPRIKGNQV
ncbi:UBASH3B [Cordylochernes scorpioides]|uniref:UBASH3B n=1 Tax=Cordylochernes scorpioides TaxID=51811 RepID=A0ABY6K0X6_9ARAC|nr:UBASH3B [Cordylochernes scorpioides]